jgi:predicted AlkP superfamily phosphohydrolase/phosphomutase
LYRRCDSVLARVLDKTEENTLLIVLSDHGFNSFRRTFDTNTWLWQNNLLALKDGKQPEAHVGDSFASVDWSRTSAYAVGLGGIYLNMKGREHAGILEEGSAADRVRGAIEEGLTNIQDGQARHMPIRGVSRRDKIYSGPYVNESPDMLINFSPGYRVSWQSAMGGFSQSLFENNSRRWSGDHIIDPEAVPGVLFMNRHQPFWRIST